MQDFLTADSIVNFKHPLVAARAAELAVTSDGDKVALARRCYRFVRDEISHSGDVRSDRVTLTASETLAAGTGWCFAKSHLLAALLRANGIPAALCYQRLQKDGSAAYTLHGLNAVYLPATGWYRCDARGNKPGVQADFTPPVEQLAWPADDTGECNLSGLHARPLARVVRCLRESSGFAQVLASLPDIEAA